MNLYCVLSFFIFSSASLLKVTLCVTSMGYFCCCYPQKMRESHTNHKEWAQKGHRHIFSIYHALWALTFFKFSVIFLLSLWLSLWLLFFIVWKESRKVSQKMIHHPHITCNLHEQKKNVGFFCIWISYIFCELLWKRICVHKMKAKVQRKRMDHLMNNKYSLVAFSLSITPSSLEINTHRSFNKLLYFLHFIYSYFFNLAIGAGSIISIYTSNKWSNERT